MIFHRLGLISKNQRGFTLIGLMLAIAITGIVTAGVTTTMLQVLDGSARINNHMTAVRQVQSAGYWVSHDVQMAKTVEPEPAPDPDGFPLNLVIPVGPVNDYSISYLLDGDKLKRQVINGSPATLIAEYIDQTEKDGEPQTKCEFIDGVLIFTVTATVQEQSETRVYEVIRRPGS